MDRICLLALLFAMVCLVLLTLTVKGGAIAAVGLISGSASAAWLGFQKDFRLQR